MLMILFAECSRYRADPDSIAECLCEYQVNLKPSADPMQNEYLILKQGYGRCWYTLDKVVC